MLHKYTPSESAKLRFWSKVAITADPEKCWEWQCPLYNGYGRFSVHSRSEKAHRVSWLILHGEIPNNLWVLHKCDNRKCVNPNHLFLGTVLDNVKDMLSKNRQAPPEQTKHCGEDHVRHKLTDEQVVYIRTHYPTGEVTQWGLAHKFGVSQRTVWRVIHGQSWRHI